MRSRFLVTAREGRGGGGEKRDEWEKEWEGIYACCE